MRRIFTLALLLLCLSPALAAPDGEHLPRGFVFLRDVAPEITQDIRYYGWHNFLGRPVKGYEADECILTDEAAKALKAANAELNASGLALKVYDCYRPQRAVNDFVAWSRDTGDHLTKDEFYPNVDKKDFFDLGYVARKSGHSRGSTVDLTIIPMPGPALEGTTPEVYSPGQELTACTAPYETRFKDGSVDMGTGFDCMDERSHSLSDKIPYIAQQNRLLLRTIMGKYGFAPYEFEWWHFTLKNEPFPNTFFDFPVAPRQ